MALESEENAHDEKGAGAEKMKGDTIYRKDNEKSSSFVFQPCTYVPYWAVAGRIPPFEAEPEV